MRKLGLLVDTDALHMSVSDIMNWTAEPLATTAYNTNEDAFEIIENAINMNSIDTIVMGISTNNIDLKGYQESFGKELSERVNSKIAFEFTDIGALQMNHVDAEVSMASVVSTLFLQKFLDKNSSTTVSFTSGV